jgi:hypothetical protein
VGKWLNALLEAEKIQKRAAHPSAKSAKTSSEGVLSVLALPYPGVFEKSLDRQQCSTPLDDGHDGICRQWHCGLDALDASRLPSGFPAPWWRSLIWDAELFLTTWDSQAADLGWTTLDLFGVHPKAPAARYSCMGLLPLLRGGRVVALTASTALIEQQSGARLTYTRRPPEPECVPLWELPGACREHPTADATRSP